MKNLWFAMINISKSFGGAFGSADSYIAVNVAFLTADYKAACNIHPPFGHC